jgi:hypothetical protein
VGVLILARMVPERAAALTSLARHAPLALDTGGAAPHNFHGSHMERTDPASSEDVKRMVQDLGSTIQRTLAEAPQIAHCLNRIKAEGYEVSLVLEATIGFNKTGSREAAEVSTFDFRVEKSEPVALKMTPLDKKFLRSLKISVEGDEE